MISFGVAGQKNEKKSELKNLLPHKEAVFLGFCLFLYFKVSATEFFRLPRGNIRNPIASSPWDPKGVLP